MFKNIIEKKMIHFLALKKYNLFFVKRIRSSKTLTSISCQDAFSCSADTLGGENGREFFTQVFPLDNSITRKEWLTFGSIDEFPHPLTCVDSPMFGAHMCFALAYDVFRREKKNPHLFLPRERAMGEILFYF